MFWYNKLNAKNTFKTFFYLRMFLLTTTWKFLMRLVNFTCSHFRESAEHLAPCRSRGWGSSKRSAARRSSIWVTSIMEGRRGQTVAKTRRIMDRQWTVWCLAGSVSYQPYIWLAPTAGNLLWIQEEEKEESSSNLNVSSVKMHII